MSEPLWNGLIDLGMFTTMALGVFMFYTLAVDYFSTKDPSDE